MSTRRPYRSMEEICVFLGERSMTPRTVIDVGAAWGTPELLCSFPQAYHILIDPVPVYANRLLQLLKKYKGEYHPVALSDKHGSMSMNVSAGGEVGAALVELPNQDAVEVSVETLDRLFSGRALDKPILVKTDCQGYDMHVMRGGKNFLKDVDIAICEVNMFHPTGRPELPDFGDTIITMRELGFAAYDIISYQTRPLDNALGYIDIVFARDNGKLRKHHRWA